VSTNASSLPVDAANHQPPDTLRQRVANPSMEIPVVVSWTGRTLLYNPGPNATVRDLQLFAESRSSVAPQDQVILFGPPFQNAHRRSHISVLRGKQVFLYNRRSLSRSVPELNILDAMLNPQQLVLPHRKELSSFHSSLRDLAESEQPLLVAVAEFERKFFFNVTVAEMLHSSSESRLRACVACLKEQSAVIDAVRAAQANLLDNDARSSRYFKRFLAKIRTLHRKHQFTLDNFERNLHQTAKIVVHEVLQDSHHRTLHDWLPAEYLMETFRRTARLEDVIWERTTRLEQTVVETSTSVLRETEKQRPAVSSRSESARPPSRAESPAFPGADDVAKLFESSDAMQREISVAQQRCERQRIISEEVGLQYHTVFDEVVQAQHSYVATKHGESPPNGTQLQPVDMCARFEALRQKQENTLLAEAHANDAFLQDFMRRCGSAKLLAVQFLFRRLRSISALQTRVREHSQHVRVLKDALTKQKAVIEDLEHVEKMPNAYKEALVEITKRHNYKSTFVAEAKRMMDNLGSLRDAELDRRSGFLKSAGKHLPKDFVPALAEYPPLARLDVPRFDERLPNIVVALNASANSAFTSSSSSGADGSFSAATTVDIDGDLQKGSANAASSLSSSSSSRDPPSSMTSGSNSQSSEARGGHDAQDPTQVDETKSAVQTGLHDASDASRTVATDNSTINPPVKPLSSDERQVLETRCKTAEAQVAALMAQVAALQRKNPESASSEPSPNNDIIASGLATASGRKPQYDEVQIGPLKPGDVALFLPSFVLFPGVRRSLVAAQRTRRPVRPFVRTAQDNARAQPEGAQGSMPDEPEVDSARHPAKTTIGQIPHFLSDASRRSAVALVTGSHLQPDDDHDSSEPWPASWPVQVVAKVLTVAPSVATVDDNPFNLAIGASFVQVNADILDCTLPHRNYTDKSNDAKADSHSESARGRRANIPPLGSKFVRLNSPNGIIHPVTPTTPGTVMSMDYSEDSEPEPNTPPSRPRTETVAEEHGEDDGSLASSTDTHASDSESAESVRIASDRDLHDTTPQVDQHTGDTRVVHDEGGDAASAHTSASATSPDTATNHDVPSTEDATNDDLKNTARRNVVD